MVLNPKFHIIDVFKGFWVDGFNRYNSVSPHEGYQILHQWESEITSRFASTDSISPSFVVTSNVDGHFSRSGFKHVAEIHGSVSKWQCGGIPGDSFEMFQKGPCCQSVYDAPTDYQVNQETKRVEGLDQTPKCQFCNVGIGRP